MAYYVNLFSPETYEAFTRSDRTVAGFRERQQGFAKGIVPGDKLICYVTKLSRWVGVLEVGSGQFFDSTPIFAEADDPFTLRFNVIEHAWLPLEEGIPVDEDICWTQLSFTKALPKKSSAWTGIIRGSLRQLTKEDGSYLEQLITSRPATVYPLSEADLKKIRPLRVKAQDKEITVSIPEDIPEQAVTGEEPILQRESIRIQAFLAEIGERMNYQVWIPKSDRQRVLQQWTPKNPQSMLQRLPLNYDDATLKTIENIDVLWIRRQTIIRAFEVEHTTSIYSGILRMADLMALQPNLTIKTHIVAPVERREKVLEEIKRPVFTLLEKGPLKDSCTFVSYDAVKELLDEKRLEYMNADVLDVYAETAEDI